MYERDGKRRSHYWRVEWSEGSWLESRDASFGQQTPASRGVHGVSWREQPLRSSNLHNGTLDDPVIRTSTTHYSIIHDAIPDGTPLQQRMDRVEGNSLVPWWSLWLPSSHCHIVTIRYIRSLRVIILGFNTELGFSKVSGVFLFGAHLFPSKPTSVEIIIVIISGFSKRSA